MPFTTTTTLLWCVFVFGLFIITGFEAKAYTDLDKTNAIAVVSVPQNPKALESVTITLTSDLYVLEESTISWSLNNVRKISNVGQKSFTFKLGPTGTKTELSAIIETLDGVTLNKRLIFEAGDITLLWQADTYTPPSYLGKALPSANSKVTVLALATFLTSEGKRIPPRELSYTWKQNGQVMGNASGNGQQSFSYITNTYNRQTLIGVEVKNPKTNAIIDKEIAIMTEQPRIVFYEEQPLSGTNYARAIKNNLVLQNPTISLKAEPFFFSQDTLRSGSVVYNWSINNKTIETAPGKAIINLQKPEEGEGIAQLLLKIESLSDIVQLARDSLEIKFAPESKNP